MADAERHRENDVSPERWEEIGRITYIAELALSALKDGPDPLGSTFSHWR